MPSCGDIQIEIRRQETALPDRPSASEPAACAQWLRAMSLGRFRPDQVWLRRGSAVDMSRGSTVCLKRFSRRWGDPRDGTAYAFRNRNGKRITLLIWDGTGVWLCGRLHQGRLPGRRVMTPPVS
ncbi:MAG: IS66 family insertion sequence element accessory protein TnpB [Propionivibrio sp.]|nr:IS66 family insertion sequence element accessory protein TnpB [Propionivibrio sp.]